MHSEKVHQEEDAGLLTHLDADHEDDMHYMQTSRTGGEQRSQRPPRASVAIVMPSRTHSLRAAQSTSRKTFWRDPNLASPVV